jgi:hypothetical protein
LLAGQPRDCHAVTLPRQGTRWKHIGRLAVCQAADFHSERNWGIRYAAP